MGTESAYSLDIQFPQDYDTNYSIHSHEDNKAKIIDELRNLNSNTRSAFNEYGETLSSELKWYSHDTDMSTFSTRYPELIFALYRTTENAEMSCTYYKNGKMQKEKAVITYGSFDEKKLTQPREVFLKGR